VIGLDVLDAAGEETAERLRADGLDVSYRLLGRQRPGWMVVTDCPRLDSSSTTPASSTSLR
jgi:hypothetical protein